MSRLIDADELVARVKQIRNTDVGNGILAGWCLDTILRFVDEATTVDAVSLEDYRSMEQTVNKLTKVIADAESVKHGHWVFNGKPIEKWSHGNYCSVCGEYSETCGNYCPYCGAEMDEVEE